MAPTVLAAFFALSAWGRPCAAPVLLPTRVEWEAPYLKATYAANCDGELRTIIVAADWGGHSYGITYLAHSEWLRNMPDIENWAQPDVGLSSGGGAGTVNFAEGGEE